MPRRDPWTYVGLAAFFALLLVALFGERIAPHESIYFVVEHGRDPRPYDPGLVFPFGSDILGRDLFSLVLAGARLTLVIVALGGLARVAAGLMLAIAAGWWRPFRPVADQLAALVAAIPATLVVLLIVLVFVRGETSFLVFVGGLLVTGWAGPYRVFRAELDRLAHMSFTEGAAAIGVGRLTILVRHHLPHLVPLVAMNASQQTVSALVALAELGVLAVFVGTTRFINIAPSLALVHEVGQVNTALIADPPEWGGLLANARTIDSLWTTRWLFLVPGVAFALTAVCVAAIGQSIARVYARRDVFSDLRRRSTTVFVAFVVVLVVASLLVPERYADARDWAATARTAAATATTDVERAFADAGLVPLAASYAIERDTTQVVRTGPATVRVGDVSASDANETAVDVRAFVDADTGGGRVEAPVVYLGYGISPADYPQRPVGPFGGADLGTVLEGTADAYQGIDARGKIVVVVRFSAVHGDKDAIAPDIETQILNAKKHGAAAILFVDQDLSRYAAATTPIASGDPYTRLESLQPVTSPVGTPVVVLSAKSADALLSPLGIRPSTLPRVVDLNDASSLPRAREVGRGSVDVPLERATAHVRSFVGETHGVAAGQARFVVWGVHRASAAHPVETAVGALARDLARRGAAVIFVVFDPAVDASINARDVAKVIGDRPVSLFFVLDRLDGDAVRFSSPFGDLIPALDHYAEITGARHVTTTVTAAMESWTWPGAAPYIEDRAVLITGTGGGGDPRSDAAAIVAYAAGRRALGAEELPK